MSTTPTPRPGTDREILRLAIPAFFALISEPLFLLADTAIVGHLGTAQLGALGIAAAVIGTVMSLCVFLAYGTTASVARQIGAGRTSAALTQGIDGIWLAILVGLGATGVAEAFLHPIVGAFGAPPAASAYAVTYLRIALLGLTPLLVMLAATGVLRGLQDTRTPLAVAVVGNAANVALNLALVYGAGLGIAGSAWGSVLAQMGSAAALAYVVVNAARRHHARLAPDLPGIKAAATAGVPLIIRTATLRAALLLMTYGAARFGEVPLAAMQLTMTVWLFLAFALDAIAIAAQALTGRYLGAGNGADVRVITDRMTRWGLVSGIVTGLGLAALSPFLGRLFTSDPAVLDSLVPVLLVAALCQPVAGVVFVLDGVLIGAGDGRYLALAGTLVLIAFAPAALLATSLTWLWVAFCVAFMGGRAVVLLYRARGSAWMALGS